MDEGVHQKKKMHRLLRRRSHCPNSWSLKPRNVADSASQTKALKPRLHERFFACDGDTIVWKNVASPARGENRMCSHPRTGEATDEKIAGKNREKFNELNFL